MGETDEKENAPTDTTTSPTVDIDEPKETEKLLNSNNDKAMVTSGSSVGGGSVGGGNANGNDTDESLKIDSPKLDEPLNKPLQSINDQQQQKQQQQQSQKPDVNGEEIINVPENTPIVGGEGREVKPKKIPIGGIKMPGFFTRTKPKGDQSTGSAVGDGNGKDDVAYGELIENAGNEAKSDEEKMKQENAKNNRAGFLSAIKLRNPFARNNPDKQPIPTNDEENPEENDQKPTVDPAATSAEDGSGGGGQLIDETTKPQEKCKKPVFTFRLPVFNLNRLRSNTKSNKGNDDVELGNGPNNKAGLASMETLDDSMKDIDGSGAGAGTTGKDQTDKAMIAPSSNTKSIQKEEAAATAGADDDLETVKLNDSTPDDKEKIDKEKEAVGDGNNRKNTFRTINCTIDDLAIIAGLIIFIILVTLICVFTISGTTPLKEAPLRDGKFVTAVTSCGLVEGVLEDSSYAFRGIPYAVPPIGELRWKPSKPIDNIDYCWNGTFKAYDYNETVSSERATTGGGICWQIFQNGSMNGNEDCLTLDVITPHIRYDNPLPVIVLIGADSLNGGAPNRLRPSARYARARDVIFVRPNFRIGIMGFLALRELSAKDYPPTSGNYALSDIIVALQWIKTNIEHFGGNPKSITLFGHRAGATIVTALLSSREIDGMYNRAWLSSGSAIFPGKPLREYERANERFMVRINCSDTACLLAKTNEELLKELPDTWRTESVDLPKINEIPTERHEWLILDGAILIKHPQDIWKSSILNVDGGISGMVNGNNNGVTGGGGGVVIEQSTNVDITADIPDMVIGTTAHESHSETLFNKEVEWTPEIVRKYVNNSALHTLTDEIFLRYNATYKGLVSIISDIRTICPLLALARTLPTVPYYVVTQTGGPLDIADVDADIQAILGRYEPKTPEQRRYVSAIQQLFYHYVSHGEMKQYEQKRRVFHIGQDALSKDDYPNCNFWIKHNIVPKYARID